MQIENCPARSRRGGILELPPIFNLHFSIPSICNIRLCVQAHPTLAFSSRLNKAERLVKLRKPKLNKSALAIVLMLALMCATLFGLPQDIAGGASALLGQDIIGGASVAFKRPPRVRDIAGGASTLLAKRRVARKPPEPT